MAGVVSVLRSTTIGISIGIVCGRATPIRFTVWVVAMIGIVELISVRIVKGIVLEVIVVVSTTCAVPDVAIQLSPDCTNFSIKIRQLS